MSYVIQHSRPQLFFFGAFAVVLLLSALFCASSLSGDPGAAPETFAENLQGTPVDPFAASDGRVVVLLFVRTNCPIANRYAPSLQSLNEKFHGKARFWLVYPDAAETAPQIKAHLQEFHYSIPALRDIHHALVKRAQATITPEAAVFDSTGRLLYHGRIDNWYEDFGRARSVATTHELHDAIIAALDGKTVSPDHTGAVGCYISDVR